MKVLQVILLVIFVWLMAPCARATGTSNDSIPNYTGILIVTGGALSSVQAQGDYVVNNFSTVKPLSGTYRVGFKLINANDTAVSPEVFSAAFAVALLPYASTSGTRSVVLSPNILTPGAPYRVYSQLYTTGPTPGSWIAAGFSNTSDEYRFALVDAGTDSGVVVQLNTLALTRAYAVVTAPVSDSFQVSAQGVIARLDQATQPVTTEDDQIFFDVTITGDRTGSIQLSNPRTTLPVVLANHAAGGAAASVAIDQTIDIRPAVQMDSTDSYTLTVTMSHARPGGAEVIDRQVVLTEQRFLHFNGTLMFGPVSATVTAIYNDPDFEGTVAGVGENTALGIDANGAHLNANPSYIITSGQNFQVLLGIDGTATSTDTANLDVPTGVSPEVAGVSFALGGVTLDSTGAHATGGRVRFPAGFGVASAPNIRRLMADYPFGPVDLDASMNPTGLVGLSPGMVDAQHLFAVHEDLPEQFEASSISWETTAGTFAVHRTGTRHVRADETAALDALALTPETLVAKIRPSNDGYLAAPGPGVDVDVVVRADMQGRALLEDATIDLPPSQFTTHFPSDTVVSWSGAGQLVIKAGLIDTAQSALPGAAPAAFGTLPGAPRLTLVGGLESFSFKASEDTWHFTADGGLHAEGAITDGTVQWGARGGGVFAQTAGVFATGAAHVPGNVLRGSLAATSIDFRPGELLLSGHGKPGDEAYVERPFTPDYAAGFADYAGLNVRSTGGAAQTGTSLLGDASLGPYPLSAASKYYFRKAGVSGIHAADRSFFSAKGIALTMDGFALTLTDYQVSYRDNKDIDSLVSGTVDIPGVRGNPGFTQAFSKMFFDSQGQPTELELVQNAVLSQPLAYWHARFHPITAEFVLKPSDAKQVALVFGAEVLLPGILKDPVRGGLGFLPSGKLASAADGFPGVNSRMKPPKQIGLHGPGSSMNANIPAFTVNPVGDLYFNDPYFSDPNNPVAPADGFVAFAGSIQVPFFENMLVHVIARADTGRTAIRAGWQKGQKSFFTDVNFDAGNVGFPESDGYDAYVNENEPDGFTYFVEGDVNHQRNLFNPLVRQSWLGVVDFALPVKWDPARRRFVSSVPEERAFLVVTSQRVLQQLTPSGAEIRFGLQFNRLPRVSLTSLFISDHEAEQDAEDLIQFIPDGPKLSAAVGAFENLLSGNSDQLIADGFDGVLNTFLDYLLGNGGPLNGLTAASDATKAIGAPADQAFKDLTAKLKDQLSSAAGALNLANSIFGTVADGLDIVDNGLSTADTILQKDKNGQRGAFINDSIQLATSLGLPDDSVKSVTGSITTEINGELAPTLDQISDSLDDVHSLSQSARKLVNGGRDVTAKALGTINIAETLPNEILTALHDYLNQLHDPTGQALTELGPDKLRAALKKAALDAIMGSDFVAQLQETVRDLVEPLHEEYGVIYEQVFGVLNDVVRSALEELNNQVIDHLNDEAGKINRAVGDFRNALELSKVEGSAQILGNVLDNAHLNATFGLSVPDKVTLTGTVDFKRLHGDQPVPPCVTGAADGRLQIKVTARGDASLGGGRAAHAELHGQYTMTALGQPLAVSGGLSLDADVHVDIVTLKKADFEFVVGAGDNYVRSEGAGSILVFDVNTRAFFGKTCDSNLVKWIDPQIDALFKKLGRPPVDSANPLIGYYTMADGDVVLNRILDIPDSIVLLKAGGGQGSFIFCDPNLTSIIPGMHTRLSIGVGLGPLSEQAELVALGGLAPIPLTLSSTGLPNVAASFLADPFNTLKGAVAGRFTPKFTAGPISWSKDFDFTATGTYVPFPPAPPPGFFLVRTLDF